MDLHSRDPSRSALIYIEQFDLDESRPGGIESVVRDFLRVSRADDMYVVGLTRSSRAAVGHWRHVDTGGRIVAFLAVAHAPDGSKLPDALALSWGLLRHRKKLPSAPAHCHRAEVALVARVLRIRVAALFLHNDATSLVSTESDSFWRRLGRLYYAVERFAVRASEHVVVFNKPGAERLATHYPSVRRGVTWFDDSLFALRGEPRPGPAVVLWVGRLDRQKDPVLAVRAFEFVAKRRPGTRLRFVGDGPLEARVRDEVSRAGLESSVDFAGRLTRADVAQEMQDATVLLMSSHYEGSPIVLIEAGASGLPCAVPAEADPDGWIIEGVNGSVARSRSPQGLGEAVLAAFGVPRDRCAELAAPRAKTRLARELSEIGLAVP